MLRKLCALLLALGLVAAACGSDDESSDDAGSADDEASETETVSDEEEAPDEGDDAEEEPSDDEEEGAASDGEPIKIGNVTSYSGVNVFPESATIAHLVFDRYNEQGGLDGRPIELIDEDAQDTAEGARAAALRLFEEEEVVGFCCGGSIVDCDNNADFYSENNIQAMPGAAACVEAPTVHPINTGPFLPTLHMLDFFVYNLELENVCFVGLNVPLTEVFQGQIIPLWEGDSGIEVTQIIEEPGADLTAAVTQVQNEGCEAVLTAFTEPDYQSYFQIASQQGITENIVHGMLTSGYSLSLLEAAGDTLEGVYANSEYSPYTGSDLVPEVEDYISLAEEAGEPLTSFGEGGYLAANIVIEVLESIEGEVTFESFNEAVLEVEYETDILGGTWTATGFAPGVQPNPYSQILQVQGGEFQSHTGWWIFPRSEDAKNPDTNEYTGEG